MKTRAGEEVKLLTFIRAINGFVGTINNKIRFWNESGAYITGESSDLDLVLDTPNSKEIILFVTTLNIDGTRVFSSFKTAHKYITSKYGKTIKFKTSEYSSSETEVFLKNQEGHRKIGKLIVMEIDPVWNFTSIEYL